jgi:hypothetical protein
MNIPLDRLYHYIENVAQEIYGDPVIIYRFYPHGSKNINDLDTLKTFDWTTLVLHPNIWCHDQEPLNYEFYKTHINETAGPAADILKSINKFTPPKNLNYTWNVFEKGLLLHSEKRSPEIDKYLNDNELIPVYYWNHALLARDWFRYADFVTFQKQIKKTFLIYNRAWAGTREYRLKFTDLLIDQDLIDQCQTTINSQDPELGVHYKDYKFNNPAWQPTNTLEDFLQPTQADSTSSADFNIDDYNSTDIEVVLETLFDDTRLHLTEKSLRPIACTQPFILVATHGSLEYLRSYGFKTFDTVWDESYDQITDPQERMQCIVSVMKEIASWPTDIRKLKMHTAKQIAEYNQRRFYSQEFFDLVVTELKTNLQLAFKEIALCNNYEGWYTRWQELLTYPEITEFLSTSQISKFPSLSKVEMVMQLCRTQLSN